VTDANVHKALRSGSAALVQPGGGCKLFLMSTIRARLAAVSPLGTDASVAIDPFSGTGE
jgi:hypothetical protein